MSPEPEVFRNHTDVLHIAVERIRPCTAAGLTALPHAHIKLLIEVTVEDTSVPAHIDCVPTHDPICSCHIEAFYQHLQITSTFVRDLCSTADGPVHGLLCTSDA